jgi:hypothetical protein
MAEREYNNQSFIYTMIHEVNANQANYYATIQRLIQLYDRSMTAASSAHSRPPPVRRAFQTPIGVNFFDNVVVRPTTEQIRAACVECFATAEESDTVCPITQDRIRAGESILRIRHCGHAFRKNALLVWFNRNVRCPVCRHDIREVNAAAAGSETPASTPTAVNTNSTGSTTSATEPLMSRVADFLASEILSGYQTAAQEEDQSNREILSLISRTIQNVIGESPVQVNIRMSNTSDGSADDDEVGSIE